MSTKSSEIELFFQEFSPEFFHEKKNDDLASDFFTFDIPDLNDVLWNDLLKIKSKEYAQVVEPINTLLFMHLWRITLIDDFLIYVLKRILNLDFDKEELGKLNDFLLIDLSKKVNSLYTEKLKDLDKHEKNLHCILNFLVNGDKGELKIHNFAYTDKLLKLIDLSYEYSDEFIEFGVVELIDFKKLTYKKTLEYGRFDLFKKMYSLSFGQTLDQPKRLVYEKTKKWDKETCVIAAENGHLDCLTYAHTNGCEWDHWTCAWAAYNGHLDCLTYAHENGCEWDEETCVNAAKNGHLDCLTYAHTNSCKWDKRTCAWAALNGNLDCLTYAHTNGCKWDIWTCANAAKYGYLDCLTYAHTNSCKWDKWTCAWAALNGHLDCLTYAHTNGCEWDEDTCASAAYNGHLNCLIYAHKNGCEWNEETYANAAYNGHLDCLTYAYTNGCPINIQYCISNTKNKECLEYLKKLKQ